MTDEEVTEEMFEVLKEFQDVRRRYLAVQRRHTKLVSECAHPEIKKLIEMWGVKDVEGP